MLKLIKLLFFNKYDKIFKIKYIYIYIRVNVNCPRK